MKSKFAVVLSGCGGMDGAEISEAVSLLLALSQKGCDADVYAPNINQSEVFNHATGDLEHGAVRNVMVEAARIVRGNIKPLEELDADSCDGLILAGGFGVAKNLTNFYYKGAGFEVVDSLRNAVLAFHNAGKPVGAMCIAPIVFANIFKGKGVEITLGLKNDVADTLIEHFGIKYVECDVKAAVVDSTLRVVTTPAYMYPSPELFEIALGAVSLVEGMNALVKK